MDAGVVIVGGGQARLQSVDSLRSAGYDGKITVVAGQPELPYQHPPLSKDFLAPGTRASPLPLRGESFFADKDILLLRGVAAMAIYRHCRNVSSADGTTLDYGRLVLATGTRNRTLDRAETGFAGIQYLRALADARALHAALPAARNVVVIGAGFIGLEFAAAARARGCHTTVLEFAPRPLGRALTPVMAAGSPAPTRAWASG